MESIWTPILIPLPTNRQLPARQAPTPNNTSKKPAIEKMQSPLNVIQRYIYACQIANLLRLDRKKIDWIKVV